MLKRLAEFFQDAKGANSSARLIAIFSVFLVLGVWSYVSLRKMELQNIPEMVVVLVLGIVGGKVWQRFAEKPGASSEVTHKVETVTETKVEPEAAK